MSDGSRGKAAKGGAGVSPRGNNGRGENSPESIASLQAMVRQLQSDVDKLKFSEHKRRESVRKAREAKQAAEASFEDWLRPVPEVRNERNP